jgi:hypothetical protein
MADQNEVHGAANCPEFGPQTGEVCPLVFTCAFCGAPSWLDRGEQSMPVDYCHPEDHGEPFSDSCLECSLNPMRS